MIAYFDYATTSYRKPRCVYKAIKIYKKYGVNLGRGNNKYLYECTKIIEETRQMLKSLVKADDNYQTIFQPSATYALNLLIKGLDYSKINNVYISKFEHNAVIRPLFEMQKKFKFNVFHIDDYEEQFKHNSPDVVIISHLTNTFGILQDYKKVFMTAKKYNAITILDMAQSFGLIDTNITFGKVDAAVFAGHKTLYGFSGIGGIILNNSLKIRETIQGGTGINSFDIEMPKERPIRFEAGTLNILGIFSLYYSCKYLIKLGFRKINEIESKNFNKLKNLLENNSCLQIVKPKDPSSTIIACKVKNYSPENFSDFFSKNGIALRTGLQCSPDAHKYFNTFPSGTLRFSSGLFIKNWEFRKLKKILNKLEKKLKS